MEQKEKSSAWMPSVIKYESMEQAASHLMYCLHGQREIRDSEKPQFENILELLNNARKCSLTLNLNAYVILTQSSNSLWEMLRLHKNKRSLVMMLSSVPTNNNTHTRESEAVTP